MSRLSWIFIGATSLIVLVFGYFFFYPQITNILKIYNDLGTNQAKLNDINKEKEILNNLSKNNQLQSLFDIASKYIPEEQKSGELVIELTAIAKQSNMKVEQISLDSAKTATGATPSSDTTQTDTSKTNTTTSTTPTTNTNEATNVDYAIKISGSFSDLIKVLQSIESSSRLITISKIQLTQTTDVITAQIDGSAYYKKGVSVTNNVKNVEITKKTIDMFQNLKTYGSPIDLPTESGFGRENPFAPTP